MRSIFVASKGIPIRRGGTGAGSIHALPSEDKGMGVEQWERERAPSFDARYWMLDSVPESQRGGREREKGRPAVCSVDHRRIDRDVLSAFI